MGCRSSTAAEPREAVAPVDPATKGTPATLQPNVAKAQSSEGSDTSTDENSASSSLQMSGSGEISADPMESNEALGDPDKDPLGAPELQNLCSLSEMAGLGTDGRNEEAFLEVAAGDSIVDFDEACNAGAQAAKREIRRSVSCLLGTTPRDPSRRVSFNEDGPEVVHVEALEVAFEGTLRRANAVSSADMEIDIDASDDPLMEAVLSMHAAQQAYPPWTGLESRFQLEVPSGIEEPGHHFDPDRPPPPRCFNSRFGWCCVARGDGSLPLHGELEYDLCEGGEGPFMPYANQVPVKEPLALLHPSQGRPQLSEHPQLSACI